MTGTPHDSIPNDCMTPLDTLLMRYAAGHLGEQERLLVNAARALNPDVRSRISQFEAMGARLMCEEAEAPVSADCLSLVMARIEKPQAVAPCSDPANPCGPAPELNIPQIVHALLANVCAERKQWSFMSRGVMRMELQVRKPQNIVQKHLRLLKLAPGQSVPRHAHAGIEITLVLHGMFRDELGSFKRGDLIVITDPGFQHSPVAGDEGCVCLMLNEAKLRFYDPLARLMNTFWRI